jgi:hypothetical protein
MSKQLDLICHGGVIAFYVWREKDMRHVVWISYFATSDVTKIEARRSDPGDGDEG